jgi:uncharacterized protein YdhG (YjbR/CyaY superfamily)
MMPAKSKAGPDRHAPEEVDEYLDRLPQTVRDELEALRRIVRDVAPGCTERVSYGIPIFRTNKDLVGMSAQKRHCSLHTMSPPLADRIRAEVPGLVVSGATVHFTPEAPLERDLVERIVRDRLHELGKGATS